MKLYFENSRGEERVIAEPNTVRECNQEIKKFLDEHNFTSYYSRCWKTPDGRIKVDVGSHTEFFKVEGVTWEEWLTPSETQQIN